MKLPFPALALAVLLYLLPALPGHAQEGAAPVELQNHRLRMMLLGDPALQPPDQVRARVRAGQTIQVLIQLPEAAAPRGPLIDPFTVEASLGQSRLESFLLYKTPSLAVLLLLPDPEFLRPGEAEFSLTASAQGPEPIHAGWRIPLELSAEDLSGAFAARAAEQGRVIHLHSREGRGLRDGRVFGQRREDLLAPGDGLGRATLTAASRNTNEPHFAWAPGCHTVLFDPISTSEVLLPRREESGITVRIRVPLQDADGEMLDRALLVLEERRFLWWYPDVAPVAELPGLESTVLIVAPGCAPTRVPVARLITGEPLRLGGSASLRKERPQ